VKLREGGNRDKKGGKNLFRRGKKVPQKVKSKRKEDKNKPVSDWKKGEKMS